MTAEFPNATPRPWSLDTIEGGGWAVVVDADGLGAKIVAELDDTYGDRSANASLIVEAVNAYRSGGAVGEREEPLDEERLARALHETGIGCPFDLHWRAERHEADWHDLQARSLVARLSVNEGGVAPVARTEAEPHE